MRNRLRYTAISAAAGLTLGLAVGAYLAGSWWLRERGWAATRDEALEGRVLLAYLLSLPFSPALEWLTDVGRYPNAWLRFIIMAPTLAGSVWGAIAGLLLSLGAGDRSRSHLTTHRSRQARGS